MSHTNSNEIQYENRKTQSLSDDTLVECAELFSANYGNYSDDSDFHPGQSVRLGASYYKNNYCTPDFSEAQLKDAYSRMDMGNHPWARGTSSEVSFIYDMVRGILPQTMIDLGCGTGRHSIEFAKLGLKVCGVDFSKTHIQSAEAAVLENHVDSCTFECSDVRDMTDMEKYDLALCLYDVIGSFPSEEDNAKVIESAYRVLKPGGYFVASVMNMELTESLVPESQKGVLSENPEILLHLKPGNVMQSTGNIFDPQYLAIDTRDGLVYRKEQFGEDDMLPAEYVIRDKRYRMSEIVALIERAGFTVEDSRFVRAGAFEEALSATDPHAKEILVIARK